MSSEMTYFIPNSFDKEYNNTEKVLQDVQDLLDIYVKDHEVSVSELSIALECYRRMLAVNSKVKPQ